MTDKTGETASFYGRSAATYASDTGVYPVSPNLQRFAPRLPAGARILELGCGSGRESAWMLAQGLDVHPTDGVAEMAAEASVRLGIPVSVLPFDQIEAVAAYDGVWANACLLHVPRVDLPGILRRIRRAMTPGAVFYASYKAGGGEGTDRFGRYFNYPDEGFLRTAYGPDWTELLVEAEEGSGYDRVPTPWLHVFAQA
jgi:SAM-dependent methyltransferase